MFINNISKQFGDKKILDSVSFSLHNKVTGLLGKNGAGKTTLFEIMTGNLLPDSGSVDKGQEIVGYLPQQFYKTGQTVYEYIFQTTDPTEMHQVDIALSNVGLGNLDFSQSVETLSGGQKTKLGLATLLVQVPQPSVLLLDEPTNNLDAEGLEWLSLFLNGFSGKILLTSHDRAFLDETVQSIIYLENGKIHEYGGNYSFFKAQQIHEYETQLRMYTVQEKKIAQTEEDIDRIRSQTLQGEEKFSSRNPYQRRKIRKAAQQGVARKKKLEKFLESEEKIDKPESRRTYPFAFSGKTHTDKFIIGLQNITKSFEEKVIIQDISLSVLGKERVHITGPNGAGKTTILKLLARLEIPDSGEVTTGENIKIGYFSQEGLDLDDKRTAVELLKDNGATETEAFEYAAFLHLQKDDLRKSITSLSRGQITKLAFIILLMEKNDLLILDEPTNHLEVETREEIEDALRQYEGAIIVASHDRYFIDAIKKTKTISLY